MTIIDWSVFDKYPYNEVECKCGAIHDTHTKAVSEPDGLHHYRRHPCPHCHAIKDNVRRVSMPPEKWVI
jgi:hypothetical protein